MRILSVLISVFILGSVNLFAQDVISAKDFMTELKKNKDLVVVDAGSVDDYEKRHIRGAVSIPHKSLYKDGDVEGLIKEPAELAKIFGEKGISETTPVVVYDDGSNKYSSRVYWILKYMGAKNVKILHKDMQKAWRQVRVPLTAAESRVEPKTFNPDVNEAILADIGEVKKALASDNAVVVDARSAEEYKGTSEKPESKGHIKGAINIEYKEFLQENGDFKSSDEIREVAKKHGLTTDKKIIAYCKTSVRACPIFVALKGAGFDNVKVYDGAYSEWVSDPSNPIAQ